MIDLSADKVLCSFHAMPFKNTWNESSTMVNVTKFTIALFDVLVADEAFIKKCNGDSNLIEKYLPKPLCCWVAIHYSDELIAAYKLVGAEPPNAADIAVLN